MKFSLKEYKYSKDVCRDFPKIQKELNDAYKELYKYRQYLCSTHVLNAIIDSQEVVNRQYKYYKEVLKKKGQIP